MIPSPLDTLHRAGGATFTDFAGWDMPVRYSSDLAEHHAVRSSAGLFDISHMAEIRISGAQSADFLDYALAGRLSALTQGQAKYSLLLSETGGIIDDVIVYRLDEHEFYVIANAGNRFSVVAALTDRAAGFEVSVVDESEQTALVALQGPHAADILSALPGFQIVGFDAATAPALNDIGYYRCVPARFNGVDVLVARTGYTGEDGFELAIDATAAADLWTAILTAGGERVQACGLAARDTLRLEAGMPLYGHELGLDIYPYQAGLGRVVVSSKERFVGKEAVENAPSGLRVLVGLVSEGKRAGRAEYLVWQGDREVGVITSGALSPTLGYPIAMAFVDPDVSAEGTELTVDVRGSRIPAHVKPLPFYRRTQ